MHKYLYKIFELSMDENGYISAFKKGLENGQKSEKSVNLEMDMQLQASKILSAVKSLA